MAGIPFKEEGGGGVMNVFTGPGRKEVNQWPSGKRRTWAVDGLQGIHIRFKGQK